jgi:hypothetical protein
MTMTCRPYVVTIPFWRRSTERFAIERDGRLVLRALPSRGVAQRLVAEYGGRVVTDPGYPPDTLQTPPRAA